MKKKYKKWLLVSGILCLILVLGSFFYIKSSSYVASSAAQITAKKAIREDNVLIFEGKKENPAIIFYQGALVENKSYSIWAYQVAEAGFSVYLIQSPFNLAVLDTKAAQELIEKEQLSTVVLGGHSLGGVIASRAAGELIQENKVKGVFFLASYPDEKGSLQTFEGSVLSITGDYDNVLNEKNYQESKQFLPQQTEYQTIIGGNHAGFGSYGPQKGDGKSIITNQQQQMEISERLIQWLQTIEMKTP
ncbi:MAG TPA: alpha/beta hydrolase [Enterococcus sp.]|nr:alpha/beta hydrolase [Enterococcus sp.]